MPRSQEHSGHPVDATGAWKRNLIVLSGGQLAVISAMGIIIPLIPFFLRELGMTESAVKVAVHRLRTRYRERVREEIAHTVADPAEVDDEIRYLLTVLS